MINYQVLKETNIFYIIFEFNISKIEIEKLVNQWHKNLFENYCTFEWLNKKELKVYINFNDIKFKHSSNKNFLMCFESSNFLGLHQKINTLLNTNFSINYFFITTNSKFLSFNQKNNLTEQILNELEIVFNEYKNNKYDLKRLNKIINLYEKCKILNTNSQQLKEEYEHYFSNYSDNN